MPYYAVSRALSRLGRTAERLIPLKAQAEESRARMGLAKAKTEFDIEQRKETIAHRERVFGAAKEEREAALEERAIRLPGLKYEALKLQREEQAGEQFVTTGHFFGGYGVNDLSHAADLLKIFDKSLGIKKVKDPQPGGAKYTKGGDPYYEWQLEQDIPRLNQIIRFNTGTERLLKTWATPEMQKRDPVRYEKAKRMLAEKDPLAMAYMNLKNLRDYPPLPGSPATDIAMYTNRLKEVNAKIKRLEDYKAKEKVAKIKAGVAVGKAERVALKDKAAARKRISDLQSKFVLLKTKGVTDEAMQGLPTEIQAMLTLFKGQKLSQEDLDRVEKAFEVEINANIRDYGLEKEYRHLMGQPGKPTGKPGKKKFIFDSKSGLITEVKQK